MIQNAIPLRDVVIYPGIVTPLFVGRRKSIQAIENASQKNMQIVLVSQKSADIERPKASDVYDVGTLADIIQVMKLPDGTLKLLVEGTERVKINHFIDEHLTEADVSTFDSPVDFAEKEHQSLRLMLINTFERYLKTLQKQPKDIIQSLEKIDDISLLVDVISSHIKSSMDNKIKLLITIDINQRITELMMLLEKEIDAVDLEQVIRERVKSQMDKNHKEYYLNEQAKAIQKELEKLDETKSDHGQLEASIKDAKMPSSVEQKCLNELDKLKKMPPMSSEAVVVRNYLDQMLDYPWAKASKTTQDIVKADETLENSHYGLEDVKKRIIEHVAVQQRLKKPSGTILCLVGPPGVGKTSIAKSVAQAVNRKYVRMALGGVRDEAEIRGHRKTYIGAMPGKIVQNIIKSEVNNPLFLLDEIDKMGNDHRGDPSSAMLEVLDPEQNHAFNDHYMEVDINFSDVMFIATANSLNIPGPLLDRMEIIQVPGYTESEKISIAKDYLVPKNMKANGLKSKEFNITDTAISMIIENYTREAGVRALTQQIDKLCRKVVADIALNGETKVSISKNNIEKYLGVAQYQRENINNTDGIGRINGLAWTSVGGELLTIEVAVLPGKGKISLTGKLGDVMKESIEASMTVVKSYVGHLGVSPKFFQEHDFHIHLPEAATPKDGPSAGGAMTIALLSAVMHEPISNQIAMTGEITLQGRILPIGGLKEKLFAAVREGMKTVYIPKSNEKDLADIPAEITNMLQIIAVTHIDEIIYPVFSNKLNLQKKNNNNGCMIEKYLSQDDFIGHQH